MPYQTLILLTWHFNNLLFSYCSPFYSCFVFGNVLLTRCLFVRNVSMNDRLKRFYFHHHFYEKLTVETANDG